ncbi:hypothetical protein ACGFNU_33145 [Spirillospora sp. NPDC048911]|uniref:hypothetical protein n=1 Tax=Spirillospora sp. NPDC048911 TaxID=3364527 RepID=UPI0037150729
MALRPSDDPEAWSHRVQAAEVDLAALTRRRYPDGIERVRALLAWAGLAAREPGGMYWYERAVEQQLLAEPADLIFAALTTEPPSPAQLDGAANLFGCMEWTTAHGKKLPRPLTSLLVAHIQPTAPIR